MKQTTYNIMIVLVFLLFICKFEYCYSNNASHCIEVERIALLKFKKSLIDRSNRLSSWTGLDCCKWEGVFCDSIVGHVLKLDLHNPATYDDDDDDYENYSNNCLGGEISPSLINLTHLNYLDLSLNNFSEIQIPNFLGSFKNMRYLNLSSSGFVGNIPTHLGNLSRLEYLHLGEAWVVPIYNNDLATDNLDWLGSLSSLKSLDMSTISIQHSEDWLRTINKFVSLSSLNLSYCGLETTNPLSHVNSSTSLISLDLSSNRLDSTILPWLSNLTRLEHLHLSRNQFTGTQIPLCKLHNLVSLDLSGNYFQGLIPKYLGNLTSLTFLSLGGNMVTGSIPNSLNSLCSLQYLDFSGNKLTGFIRLPSKCRSYRLEALHLNDNNFNGQLPNGLYKHKNLESLDLSSNSFSGPIADSIGNLSMLHDLFIGSNKFSGSMPSSIGKLANLVYLDISDNFFTGAISESHFSNLSKLISLDISVNLFVLNVSSNWVPPFQLLGIYMQSVKVGPHFPHWLRSQKHVESLIMSNASISDVIPDWFGNFLWNSVTIDLSKNHLSGELLTKSPHVEGYKKAALVWNIRLSENYLSGTGILEWLCNFKNLRLIGLSTNKLSGEIPSCLGELQYLTVLDLANNNLHGHIPNLFGSMYQLKSLSLRNNRLEGKLPLSLQNLTSLVFLDLSENELVDVIPSWIGEKLSSMRFLIFHANNFYGDIPLHLCQLHDLQLLDLGLNNISGYIPRCFDNLTGMIYDGEESTSLGYGIWVSTEESEYENEIQENIKGLTLQYNKTIPFLVSIDLSGNHLVGMIPTKLTSLHGLKNLNLSGNHLSGPIPKTIGNLSNIESLDLSRNVLSGPIPPSLSALNFLSYLNLSFNHLYGRIPTGNQLQTLNDPSIYIGNEGLCGVPLSKGCPGDVPSFVGRPTDQTDDNDSHEFFMWFYAGIGPGFFVGFIGVLSILLFKRSWSYAYFKFLGIAYNKIFCK